MSIAQTGISLWSFIVLIKKVMQTTHDECQMYWIIICLLFASIFMVSLIFNYLAIYYMRMSLIANIHAYLVYQREPEITIKY